MPVSTILKYFLYEILALISRDGETVRNYLEIQFLLPPLPMVMERIFRWEIWEPIDQRSVQAERPSFNVSKHRSSRWFSYLSCKSPVLFRSFQQRLLLTKADEAVNGSSYPFPQIPLKNVRDLLPKPHKICILLGFLNVHWLFTVLVIMYFASLKVDALHSRLLQ